MGEIPAAVISRRDNSLIVTISGEWSANAALPETREINDALSKGDSLKALVVELQPDTRYDSTLASYLFQVINLTENSGIEVETGGIPEKLMRLIHLGQKVPERVDSRTVHKEPEPWIIEFGKRSQSYLSGSLEIATFTGEWVLGFSRIIRGKSKLRWEDFWHLMKTVSLDALPIVALISFLVGMIISFLGAVTLKRFGAEFAVAYLVGFGILREMGAIMTSVIMAGRTGAAFAAQIGSMKINEEIDALKTLGISEIDFIVLPRLLALFIMMPLLTVYSNVIGILSGWLVAEGLMGVPGPVFFEEMTKVVDISDFLLGMFKACVFGILVATAGCLRGLQCGNGADAVGIAATRAVVAGITLIIFSNAVIDWAAATLGI